MRFSVVKRFRFIVSLCCWACVSNLFAQHPTTSYDNQEILPPQLAEQWARINASKTTSDERSSANKAFIPLLARALAEDGDLSINFSSLLPGLFEVYPPDSSFRILTWELLVTSNHVRHFGVIQQRKSPKALLPLFDASDMHPYRTKGILSRNDWFGQIYYDVSAIGKLKEGHYILTGYDSKDSLSDFKILDVLVFKDGEAYFGAPLFMYPPDMPRVAEGDITSQDSLTTRLFFEHKEGTMARLSITKPSNDIIYSHLSPIHRSAKETLYNYVPDGTDAGYRWNGTYWEWIPDPSAILPTD